MVAQIPSVHQFLKIPICKSFYIAKKCNTTLRVNENLEEVEVADGNCYAWRVRMYVVPGLFKKFKKLHRKRLRGCSAGINHLVLIWLAKAAAR